MRTNFEEKNLTFKSINAEDINTELFSALNQTRRVGRCEYQSRKHVKEQGDFSAHLRMPDGSALVDDNAAVLLEVLDQRSGVASSSFDDSNTLLDSGLCEARVVWRGDARQEGDVDTERL
jgi:hypothetical protein